MESLCVVAGSAVWAICCDVVLVDHDGNAIDAAILAAVCGPHMAYFYSYLTCARVMSVGSAKGFSEAGGVSRDWCGTGGGEYVALGNQC